MTDTEIFGNTWIVIPEGMMLLFSVVLILVVYYLGFFFGIQMEKSNEEDRKLFAEKQNREKNNKRARR